MIYVSYMIYKGQISYRLFTPSEPLFSTLELRHYSKNSAVPQPQDLKLNLLNPQIQLFQSFTYFSIKTIPQTKNRSQLLYIQFFLNRRKQQGEVNSAEFVGNKTVECLISLYLNQSKMVAAEV